MKPELYGALKRPKKDGAEAVASLQEELVAAIHGAFEVAVEIAIREVTKLVGQATGDVLDEIRRENDSLKQRLLRAEALLDSAGMEERGGGGSPPAQQLLTAADRTDQPPHLQHFQKSPSPQRDNVYNCTGVRGEAPPAGHSFAQLPAPDSQEEECDGALQHGSDTGACFPLTKEEVSDEISRVVRAESVNQPCQELSSRNDESTLKQVAVKQEGDSSACCLDSIKVEDFNLPCLSAVQSKILEEWKPEALDNQSQESNSDASCTTRLTQEFPNIFQQAELAPIPEASQGHGAHVQTSRSLGHAFANLYTCKTCGQTFHLPSLLRRHSSQCQQRLQQSHKPPVDGGKRTRLQLYPPVCSPFRCTVCNREFNRMQNLKTHFRIHTGERPYTCAVCSKCFRHSGALTRHFRTHTGEKPYICGQCGKSFTNCGGLRFHQRSHSKQLD